MSARNVDWQLTLGLLAMQVMCNVLVAPALFYALLKVIQTGTAPSVNEAYRWGLSKIPKLFGSLHGWILTCLGLILLVIPGIILSLAFVVTYPVAVFEKGSAVNALRRSSQLTRGHRWNILAASMVIGLLVWVAGFAAGGVVSLFVLNGISFWPITVAGAIVGDIFFRSFNCSLPCDLRHSTHFGVRTVSNRIAQCIRPRSRALTQPALFF